MPVEQLKENTQCTYINNVTETPEEKLNTKEPTWREITMLLCRLWSLLQRIWIKGIIPTSWKRADGCLVPKEMDSSDIGQFRTISLLSVECKIFFFSVLARRLTIYMVKNKYVDTSLQKGGILGSHGCLEHTSIIS